MPKNDISKAFSDLNKQIKQSISQVEGEFPMEIKQTPEGLWEVSVYENRSRRRPLVVVKRGTEKSAIEAATEKIAQKSLNKAFK